ncbi:MAG: hypothetical protein M9958_05930 [Chitinophagales bacterium]|nr:hypothetical protein [Chitinophagales bacterium]
MKRFYLITIIALLASCGQSTDNESIAEATEPVAVVERNVVTEEAPILELIKEEPKLKVGIIPESELPPIGGESYNFSEKEVGEKSLIFYNATENSGKIIINNKPYRLNKMKQTGDSGYEITGNGIRITINKINWKTIGEDEPVGDCSIATVPSISISTDEREIELKNVFLLYCYIGE